MKIPCLTVTQLTALVKNLLEESFTDLTVEGELSNAGRSSTGHFFFNIKDEGAVLRGVMFKNSLGTLGFQPRDGMKVQIRGRLSVYEKTGEYRLIANTMTLAGTGDILARLEELKRKLAGEGLFDEGKKRPLPLLPSRIVLITSPTGAALHDMLKKLDQRDCRALIRILPVAVQGSEAPGQIVRALDLANTWDLGDVIILGRGGGSLEDLLAFSDEGVVRRVAASRIPVISAVGHQVDWALSDYAADHRSPTPTAAAEEVSLPWFDASQRVLQARQTMVLEVERQIERLRLLFRNFQVDHLEENFRKVLQPTLLRLDDAKENLIRAAQESLTLQRHRLTLATRDLEAYDPLAVLTRGYSVVLDSQGRAVTRAQDLQTGEEVHIRHHQGQTKALVKETTP